MTSPAQPQRYVALDSLRGICACMVFMCHVPSNSAFAQTAYVRNSWLFVDFFFVLSGFVIGTSYGQRLGQGYSIARFMTLRFFRVYPLHLFVLALFLAFEIAFAWASQPLAHRAPFAAPYDVPSLFYSFALVQIVLGPEGTAWNGPAWSIAAEFWTYLVFAVAIALFPRRISWLCVAVAIAAPLWLAQVTDRNMNAFHAGALARCLFGFAFGVLCWKLPERIRACTLPAWLDQLLEFGAVALVIGFVTAAGTGRLSLAAPIVFSVVVLTFARQRAMISRLLLWSPMVTIGTLSYSIYMIHLFLVYRYINVVNAVARKTGLPLVEYDGPVAKLTSEPWLNMLLVGVLFAGVLLSAWLTYRFIEEPGRDFGKRLARRGTVESRKADLAASERRT